ncbi:MAG TPA: spore germination protein GerW family protein [Gaiellaceae bacterium]|nr:spore germination protein GerW family protein [Gaiellaceae bacterium]
MATTTDERSQLVNDLLEQIGQTVGERAQASAIFGQPVERGAVTVVPVAKARFGFGGGGGGGSHEERQGFGRGGGGGVAVTPIGYIEVRDDGSGFKRISTSRDLLALAAAASIALITVRRLFG